MFFKVNRGRGRWLEDVKCKETNSGTRKQMYCLGHSNKCTLWDTVTNVLSGTLFINTVLHFII